MEINYNKASKELVLDRQYGFVIGAVLGDCIGCVTLMYNQNGLLDSVSCPQDSLKIDLPIGIWTEPSALLLQYLNSKPSNVHPNLCMTVNYGNLTCNGNFCCENPEIYERYVKVKRGASDFKHQHSTNCLLLAAATDLKHYDDFDKALMRTFQDSSLLLSGTCNYCAQFAKLWLSIVNLALHHVSREQILDQQSYSNLYLRDLDMSEIFNYKVPLHSIVDQQDEPGNTVRYILHVFAHTGGYAEGMRLAVKYSHNPIITGFLFGQLAGAFYGLTDIPEDWVLALQNRPAINKVLSQSIH